MAAYEPTMSYRLIYIFAIHDKDHEGYLKIGDTTFDSTKSYKQLPPNCEELNQAARDRIDDYTKTAMVAYDLQYTELARKVVTFSDGEVETSLFRDKRVHEVLYRSGYTSKNFWFSDRTSEWFEVPLSVCHPCNSGGQGRPHGADCCRKERRADQLSAADCPCCAQKESYYPA